MMDCLVDDTTEEPIPVSIKNKWLAEKLELLDKLDREDQQTIINIIDSMLTKKKMMDMLKPREQI